MTSLRRNLNLLEQQAINKRGPKGEFMQTVLHQGIWKYKPTDFLEVRDETKVKEKEVGDERMRRIRNFIKEMEAC